MAYIPKKIPERRCVGCGEHFPKSALVRIVRRPDEGGIVADLTGKLSGRGAYLCRNAQCLKKAQKARRLENALECPIPPEIYERLEAELCAEGSGS